MSREIKFRAWLKDDKRMVEVEEIHFRHQLIEYYDGNYDDCWLEKNFDKIELMQYTGLKDKNGKEIYEGDIVNFTCGCYNQTGFITYFNGAFFIEFIDDREEQEFLYYADTLEIIGNAYQHPELLEENYE